MKDFTFKHKDYFDKPSLIAKRRDKNLALVKIKNTKANLFNYLVLVKNKLSIQEVHQKIGKCKNLSIVLNRNSKWMIFKGDVIPEHHIQRFWEKGKAVKKIPVREILREESESFRLKIPLLVYQEDYKREYINKNISGIDNEEKIFFEKNPNLSYKEIFIKQEEYNQRRRNVYNKHFEKFLFKDVYVTIPVLKLYYKVIETGELENSRFFYYADVVEKFDDSKRIELSKEISKRRSKIISEETEKILRSNEELRKNVIKLEKKDNLQKLIRKGFDENSFRNSKK